MSHVYVQTLIFFGKFFINLKLLPILKISFSNLQLLETVKNIYN